MAKITMIENAKTMMTTFCFDDGNGNTSDIHVPKDQAMAYKTAIENASWATLNQIWLREGETVIKSN